jgi:hypothetical protein
VPIVGGALTSLWAVSSCCRTTRLLLFEFTCHCKVPGLLQYSADDAMLTPTINRCMWYYNTYTPTGKRMMASQFAAGRLILQHY